MSVIIKDVFTIQANGSQHGDQEKNNHWSRIGVAFVNRDNSLNVVLDALPLSGRLLIRDRHVPENEEIK